MQYTLEVTQNPETTLYQGVVALDGVELMRGSEEFPSSAQALVDARNEFIGKMRSILGKQA